MKKSIVIIGVGPGIAMGVAKRFAREGFELGLISRSEEKLKTYQRELWENGHEVAYAIADAANTDELITAIEQLSKEIAPIHVLHYNAAVLNPSPILETSSVVFIEGLQVGLFGVLDAIKTLRGILAKNQGSVLLTGGGLADNPSWQWSSLSLTKAGIKSFAEQLHQVLKPENIYVGAVQINGNVKESATQDKRYNSSAIGEVFWELHVNRGGANHIY